MDTIPADGSLDGTLGLLREGYEFIPNRCRRLGTDAFRTRLLLSRVVCASGEDAARMFYHPDRFTRDGAMPPTALKLLQDRGSVATLDAAAHRHRKELFMRAVGTPEAVARLAGIVTEEWGRRARGWEGGGEVVLFDEAEVILCRAVCRWAGVPLADNEANQRAREFAAMIDGAGAVGPRNWRGMALRRRTERWAKAAVERHREAGGDDGSPLDLIARHRELDGSPLDPEVAAVELINLLRPTVAVARFVTFAAVALHDHPEWRDRLRHGGADEDVTAFAQEVRRFYPFFPFVGGRVREPFTWRGHRFETGAWVLLDLYGTNRDPRSWTDPDAFRPERFLTRRENPFDLVPQGGGDYRTGHRCPGEPATVEIIKAAARWLAVAMEYDVPAQDLSINLARIPAQPASRFRIARVRVRRSVPVGA